MKNPIWVEIEGRKFIVVFDAAGLPLRIKERKHYGTYPLDGYYNAPYWSAKHHKTGSPKAMPSRILLAAQQKETTS